MPYIPKTAYHSKDPEKRAKQLANLRPRVKGQLVPEVRKTHPEHIADPHSREYKSNIIRFLQHHYYLPETKRPVVLEGWQKEKIFKPIFYDVDELRLKPWHPDPIKKRKYTLALIGLPKKNYKSTMEGMIASFFLFQEEDNGEIIFTANSKEQTTWVSWEKFTTSLRLNPLIFKHLIITKDYVRNKKTGTVARIVAPNYKTGAGSNPNLVIFDELWAYLDTPTQSARKFFTELTTVPTRRQPLTIIFTYAGYDEDSLLYELYQKGLQGIDEKMYFFWVNDNLASCVTQEYLETQRTRLRPNDYLRLHENRWTSGEEQFIDIENDWDACVSEKHHPLLPGKKDVGLVLGVDIGVKHDTAAVEGTYKQDNKIKQGVGRKWQPTKENPLDIEETIEAYILQLAGWHNIMAVYYDPYQFHRSAMTLSKEGVNMIEFPQTVPNLTDMSQNLYDLVKGRNIVLYPDDELRKHTQKGRAKEHDRGWRIVKGQQSHKIDRLIAFAMSALGSTRLPESLDFGQISDHIGGRDREASRGMSNDRVARQEEF